MRSSLLLAAGCFGHSSHTSHGQDCHLCLANPWLQQFIFSTRRPLMAAPSAHHLLEQSANSPLSMALLSLRACAATSTNALLSSSPRTIMNPKWLWPSPFTIHEHGMASQKQLQWAVCKHHPHLQQRKWKQPWLRGRTKGWAGKRNRRGNLVLSITF